MVISPKSSVSQSWSFGQSNHKQRGAIFATQPKHDFQRSIWSAYLQDGFKDVARSDKSAPN
jgi:hypothetical protein